MAAEQIKKNYLLNQQYLPMFLMDASVMKDEIFGPVLPITGFTTADEAKVNH